MHDTGDTRDLSILEEMGYEHEDIELKGAPKMVAMFFGGVILHIIAGGFVFWLLNPQMFSMGREQKVQEFRRLPSAPNPLLQTNRTAHEDVQKLKQEENKKIDGYGWVDKDKNIARVPVEWAEQLVLRDGLPTRPNPVDPESSK